MPLEPTTQKEILRLTMPAPTTKKKQPDPEMEICEIVCYLRLSENGLSIYYSHHESTTRTSTVGVWEDRHVFQMPLSPGLKQMILAAAMFEFWSSYDPKVGSLTRPNNLTEIAVSVFQP